MIQYKKGKSFKIDKLDFFRVSPKIFFSNIFLSDFCDVLIFFFFVVDV